MAKKYADENARIDGAVFPLENRAHEKMPEHSGVIEFSRDMLKSMVDEAKKGHIPVKVRLAVWPNQTSKAGNPYRFVKMEVLYPDEEPAPKPESEGDLDLDGGNDDMPWDND